MLDVEAVCQLTHCHVITTGKALDRQKRLILLRHAACGNRRILAEPQELPQREPE